MTQLCSNNCAVSSPPFSHASAHRSEWSYPLVPQHSGSTSRYRTVLSPSFWTFSPSFPQCANAETSHGEKGHKWIIVHLALGKIHASRHSSLNTVPKTSNHTAVTESLSWTNSDYSALLAGTNLRASQSQILGRFPTAPLPFKPVLGWNICSRDCHSGRVSTSTKASYQIGDRQLFSQPAGVATTARRLEIRNALQNLIQSCVQRYRYRLGIYPCRAGGQFSRGCRSFPDQQTFQPTSLWVLFDLPSPSLSLAVTYRHSWGLSAVDRDCVITPRLGTPSAALLFHHLLPTLSPFPAFTSSASTISNRVPPGRYLASPLFHPLCSQNLSPLPSTSLLFLKARRIYARIYPILDSLDSPGLASHFFHQQLSASRPGGRWLIANTQNRRTSLPRNQSPTDPQGQPAPPLGTHRKASASSPPPPHNQPCCLGQTLGSPPRVTKVFGSHSDLTVPSSPRYLCTCRPYRPDIRVSVCPAIIT